MRSKSGSIFGITEALKRQDIAKAADQVLTVSSYALGHARQGNGGRSGVLEHRRPASGNLGSKDGID
jgi:hypothetical protein